MPTRVDFTGARARVRGSDWSFTMVVDGGLAVEGAIVSMCIKQHRTDADPGLVTIAGGYTSSYDTGVTVSSDTTAVCLFTAAKTTDIPAGRVWYQVKVTTATTASTPVQGFIEVLEWNGQRAELPAIIEGDISVATTVTGDVDVLDPLLLLGSRLHFWYDAELSDHTANPISQLNDLGSYAYHLTQATAGQRPSYNASGGPNDLPWISFADTTRRLLNTTIALASNKALTFFAVAKGTTGQSHAQCAARSADGELAGDVVYSAISLSSNLYQSVVRCHGVIEEADNLSVPLADANWHVRTLTYPATGMNPVAVLDHVAASPPHTSTGKAGPVETLVVGHANASGGGLFAFLCGEDMTPTEIAQVRGYLQRRTELTPTNNRWVGILGQSNAALFVQSARPTGSATFRLGISSAALGVNFGPWPFGWGPDDPYGWRAETAVDLAALGDSVTKPPAILWFQGEADASAVSDHYQTDLLELIADMDERIGHSNTIWGIVRLNTAFSSEAPVGGPLVRAAQAAVVAALSTRAVLIDVDDLTPDGSQHYSSLQYLEIYDRFLEAVATLTGDVTWEG